MTWIFAALILFVSLVASSYNGAPTAKGSASAKDDKMQELMDAPPAKSAPKTTTAPNQ